MLHITSSGVEFNPTRSGKRYCTQGIVSLGSLPDGREFSLMRTRGKFNVYVRVQYKGSNVCELYKFLREALALTFFHHYFNSECARLKGIEYTDVTLGYEPRPACVH